MKLISIIFGLLILPVLVYNENAIEIKGTVIDSMERTPLIDSHIYVKGTHIGVVSDENGEFELVIPLIYKNRPIIVSYLGYSTFEEKIVVAEDRNLQIALQPTAIALDEIVVMPGKVLMIDKAIDAVLAEYTDQDEMLTDFYTTLLAMDENQKVLKMVMEDYSINE